MATAMRYDGGELMVSGERVAFREHWVLNAGKKGTARVYVREEPCTEEQRKKNRERLDAAVLEMWKSVQMKRAAETA